MYNEPIRTSNAAETFHSHLYRKLPKHGNFYGFLEFLCELEATKSIDFLKAISGCTSVYTARKSYGKKRSMFIQNRYQLLREKKITLSTLLAQFSKMKNCMLEEDFINTIDSADDMESDANNSEEEDTDAEMQQGHYLSCIVCCQNERQILFDPCKHFKVCQPCYQQIKGRAEKTGTHTLCPICRAIITDATFIYC